MPRGADFEMRLKKSTLDCRADRTLECDLKTKVDFGSQGADFRYATEVNFVSRGADFRYATEVNFRLLHGVDFRCDYSSRL
jgi:hypothetical protein